MLEFWSGCTSEEGQEAKLAVKMAKLRTYLALPQYVLSFSSRGLLTFIMGSIY